MAERIRAALSRATMALKPLSDTAGLDAEVLMAHAIGVSREAMLLHHLEHDSPPSFDSLLARRLDAEPVAYIVGRRDFWTIELEVAPGVLIPRADSETLIEAAVAHFGSMGPTRVIDLGTGSGALLLAALAEWPGATGVGIDLSDEALAIAAANAERLGLAPRAAFVKADWAYGVEGPFDLILCNPPYVESGATLSREVAAYEPATALYAGPDGLADYRRLAPQLCRLLGEGGLAAIEIGATQTLAVSALLAEQGLLTFVRRDLAGRDRCICAVR